MDELREKLAALAHKQWSGWMEYLFEQSTDMGDSVRIPGWAVERWTRQMNTLYSDLSENEKDSDRAEADRVLAIIAKFGATTHLTTSCTPTSDGRGGSDNSQSALPVTRG